MEETLNKIKKIAAAFIKKILLLLSPFILFIIILAGAIYIIKGIDAGADPEEEENLVTEVGEIIYSNGFKKYDTEWGLDIDFGEEINATIETIEKNGGRVYDYLGRTEADIYISQFIKAELVTQYPDLRSDPSKIGTDTSGGPFQGCIQIHRAMADGTKKTLTFVEETEFNSYIAANTENDSNVLDHFTIDGAGNIVVAGWSKKTTILESNDYVRDTETGTTETFVWQKQSFPYKHLIEEYTMPFDFLWALTVIGEDPEFAYKVAELALNSKIIITIQENLTTDVYKGTETYDLTRYLRKVVKADLIVDGNKTEYVEVELDYDKYCSDEWLYDAITRTLEITEENCVIQADITYADTWIAEYNNRYTIQRRENDPPIIVEDPIIAAYSFLMGYEADEDFYNRCEQEIMNKLTELCGGSESKRDEKMGKGKASYRYTTRLIELRGERKNYAITTSTEQKYNRYVRGTSTVTDKSSQFINLFNNSRTAKNYIRDLHSLLYDVLEKNEKTADMVDIVKYLIYKSTSKNTGITEFDFNIYDTSTR